MASNKADKLLKMAREKSVRVTVAESCTGGMVSAALTDIAGSSDVFERGFVTYSNKSKTELLGVPGDIIGKYGAVSEEVAIAMAEAALKKSPADLSVSLTGIAGPGGGSQDKPVGLVYIASAFAGQGTICEKHLFKGTRSSIRKQAVEVALDMLIDQLDE